MKDSSKQSKKPKTLWTGYASLDSGLGLITGFIIGLVSYAIARIIGEWVQKPPLTDTATTFVLAGAAVLSGTICFAIGRQWSILGLFGAVGASLPLLFFLIASLLFSGITTP